MNYLLFAVVIFAVFMSGLWAVKKVKEKYNPNRWIVGFLGPFILIVPLVVYPDLPSVIWGALVILFIWTNIYFFETTKEMLESGRIKTGFRKNKQTQ